MNSRAKDSGDTVANSRLSPRQFAIVALPLLAIAAAVQLLEIEQGMQLPRMLWIAVAGFCIHAWLPLKFRLPAFLGLNLVALVVLFDPVSAVGTLGFGLLLLLLASLPIRLAYRVVLVGGVGAFLALVKADVLGVYLLYQVSGIVGGLFMFRMILYLYETRHMKETVSFWKRGIYFFLLPNLVFQLFPIVDYKTFVRAHYVRPAFETYRKGLHWIGFGILHLLLYRLVYQYLLPDFSEIHDLPDLVRYLVFNYALILRLSGIFHLCIGIVHLFGFDLPRTFDNYFLASSFSDLWRRINCYWRAFVMKMFFFPILFRFKHLGKAGVFVTVLIVFVINVFLHTYQWFWVRGAIQITQTDLLFWGVLGSLVAVNSILPPRKQRGRSGGSWSLRAGLIQSLKVFGMLCFMSLMWSMWNSGSLADWFSILGRAGRPGIAQWLEVLLWGVMAIGFIMMLLYGMSTESARPGRKSPAAAIEPVLLGVFFALAALLVVAADSGRVHGLERLQPLLSDSLNARDRNLLNEGYYDELIVPNNLGSRVWELRQRGEEERAREAVRQEHWGIGLLEARKQRRQVENVNNWIDASKVGLLEYYPNAIEYRYVPGKDILFHGEPSSINELGLRDREYSAGKPPNVLRIALLGSSPEAGMGVPVDRTSDNVLEDRLNQDLPWSRYNAVEILNFSVGNYTILNHVGVAEDILGDFDLDAVLLFVHDTDVFGSTATRLARGINSGRYESFPYLSELRQKLGIELIDKARRELFQQYEEQLRPHEQDLYFWALEHIRQFCEENGIRLVVVYTGVIADSPEFSRNTRATLFPFFRRNDYSLLDLKDVFEGRDKGELVIAPWDLHPNDQGHALVAERLFELIRERPEILAD